MNFGCLVLLALGLKGSNALQRMEMARTFSEIWTTGDPSPADQILAEDVRSNDVIYNTSGTQGRENWKQMIHGVFKVSA